jgi:twitching motility protein PilT
MIDYINKNFKKHIITVEDPVEFVFNNEKSLINQREI